MYTNSQIKDKTIVSRKGKKHLLFTNDYNYLIQTIPQWIMRNDQ